MAQPSLKAQFGDHGSLAQLVWGGQQWIQPWGLEMSDAYSFFSLETGGWQCDSTPLEPQDGARRMKLSLREGQWQVQWQDVVPENENTVKRTAVFTTLTDSWAMDLVMRFAFRRDLITQAQIADKRIVWDDANYYHQYPAQQVTLFHSQGRIQIELDKAEFAPDWQQWMYVRCSPQENAWIVHLRLLPQKWVREIIKVRSVGARHWVLPTFFSRLLHLWPRLAAHLRYAGEFKRFNFGRINAIPLNFVPANSQFTLAATVHFLDSKS
ncbi:MAG: hypothetical protein R3D55_05805 [Chloroflexota bacterium]